MLLLCPPITAEFRSSLETCYPAGSVSRQWVLAVKSSPTGSLQDNRQLDNFSSAADSLHWTLDLALKNLIRPKTGRQAVTYDNPFLC